jgi:hypothetical protein
MSFVNFSSINLKFGQSWVLIKAHWQLNKKSNYSKNITEGRKISFVNSIFFNFKFEKS